MEKQPVEDASPIKNAEFSMVMLVFRGVPGTKCHANWFWENYFKFQSKPWVIWGSRYFVNTPGAPTTLDSSPLSSYLQLPTTPNTPGETKNGM